MESIREHSANYLELLSSIYPSDYNSTRTKFEKSFFGTIAHEVAHITDNESDGADHDEGGIMDGLNGGNIDQKFKPQSINRFRSGQKW